MARFLTEAEVAERLVGDLSKANADISTLRSVLRDIAGEKVPPVATARLALHLTDPAAHFTDSGAHGYLEIHDDLLEHDHLSAPWENAKRRLASQQAYG